MYIEITKDSFTLLPSGDKLEPSKIDIDIDIDKSLLFETIKIENGKIFNLELHQNRVDRSYREHFFTNSKFKLKDILINLPKNGLYRPKIEYDSRGVTNFSYYIYSAKSIKSIKIVEVDRLDYRYKYLDRAHLIYIKDKFKEFDEVLITQDGFIKDTTIANVALYKDKCWFTPKVPLFLGTQRENMLVLSKIKQKDIHYTELSNYTKIAILNAMVEFKILY